MPSLTLSDNLDYGQSRANETGRPYMMHGWVDAAGEWHRKVCVDTKFNRDACQALGETIFQTFNPKR